MVFLFTFHNHNNFSSVSSKQTCKLAYAASCSFCFALSECGACRKPGKYQSLIYVGILSKLWEGRALTVAQLVLAMREITRRRPTHLIISI